MDPTRFSALRALALLAEQQQQGVGPSGQQVPEFSTAAEALDGHAYLCGFLFQVVRDQRGTDPDETTAWLTALLLTGLTHDD